MRSLVILLVLLAAAPAHADGPKSETTAQLLGGGGAGVSGGLILAGFLAGDSSYPFNKPLMYTGLASALITPSLGQIYAGEYFTVGMAARVLGVGLGTYGLMHYTQVTPCDAAHAVSDTCRHIDSGAIPFLGLAAIAFVGGMAYDVADASSAVQRWNERHGFTVAPMLVPASDGPAPGLSIVGQW